MELQMKKCKECGKMFHPRNPRSQYCDNKHYRPCPVCGKDVEIKYLSDPTPRCADCKKAGLRVNTSTKIINTMVNSPESLGELPFDFVERKYVGPNNFNFSTNHIYLIKAKENRPYGFIIEAIKDITDNEDVDDTEMPISSVNSYHHFFKEV